MKQNSNYTITKAVVDTTSQEVTDIYVNGNNRFAPYSTPVEVEENHTDTIDVINSTDSVEIEPSDGYDAMEKVTVTLDKSGIVNNPAITLSGISSELSIEIPRGSAWTGIITISPQE